MQKAKHFPVRDVLPGLVLVLGAAYAIGRILSGAVSPDSGPADTSGSARQPIAIVQGTEVTELYEGYLWAQYLEDSDGLVVNADCVPLEDLLPETAGEFPVLTLDAPLSLQIPAALTPFEMARCFPGSVTLFPPGPTILLYPHPSRGSIWRRLKCMNPLAMSMRLRWRFRKI